jgi:sRNA-binding protein
VLEELQAAVEAYQSALRYPHAVPSHAPLRTQWDTTLMQERRALEAAAAAEKRKAEKAAAKAAAKANKGKGKGKKEAKPAPKKPDPKAGKKKGADAEPEPEPEGVVIAQLAFPGIDRAKKWTRDLRTADVRCCCCTLMPWYIACSVREILG